MPRKTLLFWCMAVITVIFDQATKIWVYTTMDQRTSEIEVIPGFFSIVHAQNPGAALGILRDFEYRQWIFIGFTVIAIGVILNMLRQLPDTQRFVPAVLGLIFGGAIGNGIDRVHKQTVTDFLRFYTDSPNLRPKLIEWFGTAEYPSFNIADAALVVGVLLFILHYLLYDETGPSGATSAAPGATPPSGTDGPAAMTADDAAQ